MILIAIALLCIPLVAMQFSAEVDWSGFDFLVAAGLLSVIILAIETVIRNSQAGPKRIYILAAIIVFFFLLWAELAVGVFGTPFAGS